MRNMILWVESELEEVPCTDMLNETVAVMITLKLKDLRISIRERNFGALINDPEFPSAIKPITLAIMNNDAMHFKFWRYMDLFVDV